MYLTRASTNRTRMSSKGIAETISAIPDSILESFLKISPIHPNARAVGVRTQYNKAVTLFNWLN